MSGRKLLDPTTYICYYCTCNTTGWPVFQSHSVSCCVLSYVSARYIQFKECVPGWVSECQTGWWNIQGRICSVLPRLLWTLESVTAIGIGVTHSDLTFLTWMFKLWSFKGVKRIQIFTLWARAYMRACVLCMYSYFLWSGKLIFFFFCPGPFFTSGC